MRFSTPVLLCQFGWLVLGNDADYITEIDLLSPLPNTTYGMSGNHRFPIVWALQNPQLWQMPLQVDWRLENLTKSTDMLGAGNITFSSKLANDIGLQFATIDQLLIDNGTYRLTWSVRSASSGCDKTPLEKQINFNTDPNSLAHTDVYSALGLGCHNRSTIAYNITATDCSLFEDADLSNGRLPYITPCSVGLDNTALAGIRNSLDTQYNKTCADPKASFLCPLATKSAAYKLSVEAWFMGFLLMVFFL